MITLPESEATVRAWLQSLSSVSALVGDRVRFELPKQTTPELPMVCVYRVGGTADETGADFPRFSIDCWGKNKYEAARLARIVVTEIKSLEFFTGSVYVALPHSERSFIYGGDVDSWLETGGSTWGRRYTITCWLHIRAA